MGQPDNAAGDEDGGPGGVRTRPAGDVGEWIAGLRDAVGADGESDVPCDGCTACCSSSQFVPIAPDETGTLAAIPAGLLFPAPRLPRGHVVLGFDRQGKCPMLVEGGCSIYDHRPRTCRTYDCRVFAAAGIDAGDGRERITERARQWRFELRTAADAVELDAVRTAAAYLLDHRSLVVEAGLPSDATQLAVLTVAVHGLFLARVPGSADRQVATPPPGEVRAALSERRGAHR